jgi:hypothetical protein
LLNEQGPHPADLSDWAAEFADLGHPVDLGFEIETLDNPLGDDGSEARSQTR